MFIGQQANKNLYRLNKGLQMIHGYLIITGSKFNYLTVFLE